MTINQIYQIAIQMGIKNDLRGRQAVMKKLKREKAKFEELKDQEKEEYDQEKLANPYSDTRMFSDNPGQQVKRIMAGIDISVSELLLAKELSQEKPIDLIISHHPLGEALASLHEVMDLQVEVLAKYGIPINIAEKLMTERISEVGRALSPGNYQRVIQAAKILDVPLMCAHTATDNCVANFLDKLIKKNKDKIERVEDLLKILKEIPEYKEAMRYKQGPTLFAGSKENYTGKIVITEMTGGTSGSKDIYEKMSQYGIGTVVAMHMKEEYKKEAEKAHINVVIAGHMSSDSLGMNLFLDELEKKGIAIIPCSGLIRVKRFGKKK